MTQVKQHSVLRVVVAADAPLRNALEIIIGAEVDMVCVAAVADLQGLERSVVKHRPELVVIDLTWSEMASRAVDWVMENYPTPVVALDCLARTPSTRARAENVVEQGAITVQDAPDLATLHKDARRVLLRELRAAAQVPVVRRRNASTGKPQPVPPSDPPQRAERIVPDKLQPELVLQPRALSLIAVGASTGGPPCIREVLSRLHAKSPPALVVQHMPADFMSGFAAWLAQLLPVPVVEAEQGQALQPGHVYMARGGQHLALGAGRRLVVSDGPLVRYQRPSVDVLFESIAEHVSVAAAGVLLTGMGDDGAQGLLAMRKRNHVTVAQDEASSLIFGMPACAIACGAAQHIAAPKAIAEAISRLIHAGDNEAFQARVP